jgi:AcrR family transcriptional regulator
MGTKNTDEVGDSPPTASRGRGRPSVADQRRTEIVTAFVALVAEQGHANASIAEIAGRADVHRSAVHHFVGNRAALMNAALDEVWAQHGRTFLSVLGEEPTIDQTVDYLFSPHFISENAEFDDVLAVLVAVATQDDSVAERLASDYQATLDGILEILGDSSPDATAAVYQVICLAEHNTTMQRLGFDDAFSEATRRLAHSIVRPFA